MSHRKTDFYKTGHHAQYPNGTQIVVSNWTPRGSRMPGIDKVVFFGLQAALMKMNESWDREFFSRPLKFVMDKYIERMNRSIPDNRLTYDHFEWLHDYGKLPMEIWAVEEGEEVPIGVPMFVMWNTKPQAFWLTNYLETSLSANLWPCCTAATIAKRYRRVFSHYMDLCGGDLDFVDYQGHDFSYRGMMGDEAAAMTGAGHLLAFDGTDTIPALDWLERYYSGDAIGGSVTATEHSVMCMGTRESEIDTYRRLISEVMPTGIISIVSDTWDYWKILTDTLPKLKEEILRRDGKLVVRPDSGDPVKILTGDDDAGADSPQRKGSFELLWESFGGERNALGFRQLDPHIGLIYGDSITLDRAQRICERLYRRKFVPNVVLGIGSFTYQYVTRDTFGFALKSTAGVVKNELREIYKDPVTDDGTKKSAKGLTAVRRENGELKLKEVKTFDEIRSSALIRVYLDGEVSQRCNIQRIRNKVRYL